MPLIIALVLGRAEYSLLKRLRAERVASARG